MEYFRNIRNRLNINEIVNASYIYYYLLFSPLLTSKTSTFKRHKAEKDKFDLLNLIANSIRIGS